MRSTSLRFFKILLLFLLASCVSITINFPAAEVKEAAKKIEKEIRSEPPENPPKPAPEPRSEAPRPQSVTLGICVATAAEVNLNVDTPRVRALKAARKERFAQVKPYLDNGTMGEGKDGLLKIHSAPADARTRVAVNQLVGAENKDRMDLFNEIAHANNLSDIGAIQKQFANAIRDIMRAGHWYEDDNGKWVQK